MQKNQVTSLAIEVPYDDYGIAKCLLLSELLQCFMHSVVGILVATTVE